MDGVAKAKWSSGGGKNKTTYREEEYTLNSITYLFGVKKTFGATKAETTLIAIGDHTYNFSCLIPSSAPYSVEAKHGYIRYKVDANLEVPEYPWDLDVHIAIPFTVHRIEDLNSFPSLNIPVELEKIERFCNFSCDFNPLIMTMKLPKQGFVVGEKIPVKILLVNESKTDINNTTLILERKFKYQAKINTLEEREKVDVKTLRGVKTGERAEIDAYLTIPRNTLTSIDQYCRVLKVLYRVLLRSSADACCSSPEMSVAITIGNIGFWTEETIRPSAPIATVEPDVNFVAPLASAPSETLDDEDSRKISLRYIESCMIKCKTFQLHLILS